MIHDLAIDRTTNGHGNVSDFSYEDLRKFDAGFGESIPLLSTILDIFAGNVFINIEIKEAGIEQAVKEELIGRDLQGLPYEKCILVSAFDKDDNDPGASSSWNQLRIFTPDFQIALLAQTSKIKRIGEKEFIQSAKQYGATAIHPEATGATSSLIDSAHEADILVNVWTVNEPQEIQRLKNSKVDGLISDFPERL